MMCQAIGCQQIAMVAIGIGLAVQFDWVSYLIHAWQRATAEQTLAGITFLGYGLVLLVYGLYGKLHALQAQIGQLKRQEETLRRCSQYDVLSGTFNRNAFAERAKELRDVATTGVVMCDIDGLKLINDTLGHHAGDELIRVTARILNECCGHADGAFRMGGDEFLLLWPQMETSQDLEEVVRCIRSAVLAYNQSANSLPLSVSLGYAMPEDKQPTLEDLIKLADSRMYQEKKACKEKVRQGLLAILRREC